MIDVVALGECLIDFTPNGENTQGIALFARNPGGAPANVLAMNACLGGKTAFIGKVGKDGFGDFLRQTLIDSGNDAGVRPVGRKRRPLFYLLPQPRRRCHADRSRGEYRAH